MSKRAPKGIFGLPSRNMLFSFTPRVGDEWPDEGDDDDDSDYEPGSALKPMVEDIPRDSDRYTWWSFIHVCFQREIIYSLYLLAVISICLGMV